MQSGMIVFAVLILAVLAISAWMFRDYFNIPEKGDVIDNLIGEKGTVKAECSTHKRGKVYVAGAYWDAVSEFGALPVGAEIKVIEVREGILVVRKLELTSGRSES